MQTTLPVSYYRHSRLCRLQIFLNFQIFSSEGLNLMIEYYNFRLFFPILKHRIV